MEWGELYGLLVTATGMTWEYIDESMTLPRMADLTAHWSKSPPTHLLVKALFASGEGSASGRKVTQGPPTVGENTAEDIAEIASMLGS